MMSGAPQPVTVRLNRPIRVFGHQVEELVCSQEVTGADLLACDGMHPVLQRSQLRLTMIARMYRTPDGREIGMDGAKKLVAGDIDKLEAALVPFAGQDTSSEESETTGEETE